MYSDLECSGIGKTTTVVYIYTTKKSRVDDTDVTLWYLFLWHETPLRFELMFYSLHHTHSGCLNVIADQMEDQILLSCPFHQVFSRFSFSEEQPLTDRPLCHEVQS